MSCFPRSLHGALHAKPDPVWPAPVLPGVSSGSVHQYQPRAELDRLPSGQRQVPSASSPSLFLPRTEVGVPANRANITCNSLPRLPSIPPSLILSFFSSSFFFFFFFCCFSSVFFCSRLEVTVPARSPRWPSGSGVRLDSGRSQVRIPLATGFFSVESYQ